MVNTLSAASKARLYLFIALSASVLVSIYGIIEHFFPYVHYPYGSQFFYRIYERGFFYHDSNHFAAYLMFSASIFFGLFLYSQKNNLLRLCFFGAILVLLPALFWTYSRSAYVALFISALIISGFKSRKILVFTIIFLIFFVFILAPSSILERINSFKSTILNSDPHGSSIAYRIQQINYAFETFWQHPLFGIGLGSRERVFYENQFMMFLSETGLLGLSLFLGILAGVFFVAISLYKATKDMFIRGLCAGFIGGFTGLLLESNTIIVFVASRIMIPFWIITGILFWFYLRERLVQADGLKKA
ncbi:MAG: O-antigen ligase family protein [Candidatus Omnitrophica bacterium]|nr:O-antigen ligase family protein [Candidatus Omnitrophota bacterium]